MEAFFGGAINLIRFLFKPLVSSVEKILFRSTYETSTLYRSYIDVFGNKPKKLTEDIEYKLIWQKFYKNEELKEPLIIVRARNAKEFCSATILITAKNSKYRYQERITLENLDHRPTQQALPSIPFRELTFRDRFVLTPYDDITVKLIELIDKDGHKIELSKSAYDYFFPMDNLDVILGLKKGYIKRWGNIYNLQFMESELEDLQIQLTGCLISQHLWLYHFKRRLFSNRFVIHSIFWSKNLITARAIKNSLNHFLEEQKQFQKWQLENYPDIKQDIVY